MCQIGELDAAGQDGSHGRAFRVSNTSKGTLSVLTLPFGFVGPLTGVWFLSLVLIATILTWWLLRATKLIFPKANTRQQSRFRHPWSEFNGRTLVGRPIRFRSSKALTTTEAPERTRMETPEGLVGDYKLWSKRLPTSRSVIDQIHIAAKQETPICAVLLTTSPPTVKVTEEGQLPVVTELKLVRTLEDMQLLGQSTTAERIVATFHNHLERLDVLPHDARIFLNVDSQLGTKLHLIGSKKGIQFYSVNGDDPAIPSSREREQDRR